jgi:hypothetical protein
MKSTTAKVWFVVRIIRTGNWLARAMLLAGAIGVALAIYLSVRHSPAMTTVRWLPRFIAVWADHHGRFCNFPAYAMLAVPFLMVTTGALRRACVAALLVVFVALLELVQLWIPTRVADLWDIVWGGAGILAVWGIFEAVRKLKLVTSAQSGAGKLNESVRTIP